MSKRASLSELTAGEALRRAFPSVPIGEKASTNFKFELSLEQAQFALEELEPYFEATKGLYSLDQASRRPETENEIWSFFDLEITNIGG